MIRLARASDLPLLASIEQAAGEAFRELGMDAVADDAPFPIARLAQAGELGRLWVAGDHSDQPVGYILVDLVDASAHIEQVSVHPAHAGRGLGRELLDTVDAWAGQGRLEALTLTAFCDVPWNAPYYRRLDFATLDDADLTPGLRRIRAAEAAHGLDAWPRVVMRRPVASR
jgi:GNAT superfamily N-acetyltransferase